jgi:DNA-directed RNA polymerase specialized sigma24 family protein
MKYIIHNKEVIQPESQQVFFEEEVRKEVKGLEKLLQAYKKELTLEVRLQADGEQPKSRTYDLSVSLPLKSTPLVVAGKGPKVLALGQELLDQLSQEVKMQLARERKEYLHKRKRRQAEKIHQQVDTLASHKKEDNKQAFTGLLAESLPAIQKYVRRRLKMAHAFRLVKNQAISPQELVDEIYLRIFEQFNAKPEAAEQLLPWMYRIADEVLAEELQEIDFERNQVTDLNRIVWAEISSLEENFTAEADGDLVMVDELDIPSFNQAYYPAHTIIEEEARDNTPAEDGKNQAAILEQLDERQAHQVISTTLAGLPVLQRSVFDLFWLEGLEPAEISFIKQISVQEVEALLADTRRLMAEKLVSLAKA